MQHPAPVRSRHAGTAQYPALPSGLRTYCRRMGATWILVDDPRQVRHVLGGSESPGTILRSLCDGIGTRG
jgi:hypothetical protein